MQLKPYLVVSAALALAIAGGDAARAEGDAATTVRQAVDAVGGASALRAVKTVTMQGTAKHWEPDQSIEAGGEQRFLDDTTMTIALDVATGAARVDWDRDFKYPFPGKKKYSEVFADGAGYVHYDSGTPADRAMSGYRVAAERRELSRGSPVFLLGLLDHPDRLRALPKQQVDGRALDAVAYRQGVADYIVMFDGATHLPARIRVRDADGLQGDSNFDLVLGGWAPEGGIQVAHELVRELNGRPVEWLKLDQVAINPALTADRFAIPAAIKASAPQEATRDIPYQWYLRRQYLGLLVDSDAMFYDAADSPGLKLVDLGRGVEHVVGGSHNNMIVEMKDYLVVFEAPINERQSRWVINAAKAKFPGKPIKYLVLTHHHMDHTSGARTYVAEGATVIVPSPDKAFFTKVFAAPHTIDRDELQRHPRKAEIVEVADMLKISDGTREIGIYRIEAKHVDGMLIMQVPDTKLVFVTDLYSPVRDVRGNPNQGDFIAGLEKWRLTPEILAGGHGGSGPYVDLVKLQSASAN
jgi:glyoxylase-like metal-dependent hydrolase (beta-lactamase superfamily II)